MKEKIFEFDRASASDYEQIWELLHANSMSCIEKEIKENIGKVFSLRSKEKWGQFCV